VYRLLKNLNKLDLRSP